MSKLVLLEHKVAGRQLERWVRHLMEGLGECVSETGLSPRQWERNPQLQHFKQADYCVTCLTDEFEGTKPEADSPVRRQ